MPEVSDAGRHKRHAVLVTALHRVSIPHAAAWMRNGCHAGLASQFDRIVPREGEERVAGQHGALRTASHESFARRPTPLLQ